MKTLRIREIAVDLDHRTSFRIVEQSHRYNEFSEENGQPSREFRATNGILLMSVGSPEWRSYENTLFVWGIVGADDRTVMAKLTDFKRIVFAIDEYNQYFGGGKIDCLPDDLFVIE